MQRRDFFTRMLAGTALLPLQPAPAQQGSSGVFLEKAAVGTPHKGKVLAAIQPHSDDISEFAAGTVAKLIQEGYTGYMIRATNDDMGDDIGDPGTVGENVLRNERENAEVTRVLGLERSFDLNYNNHRMGDVSLNEVIGRLIFLIRLLKVDTVVGWDPWAHDEENPDHYTIARALEAACWMAGRAQIIPSSLPPD
jgi:LmbE family N-acetylglucosaminyl deacetylase